jgi:hypothetical protein
MAQSLLIYYVPFKTTAGSIKSMIYSDLEYRIPVTVTALHHPKVKSPTLVVFQMARSLKEFFLKNNNKKN